MTAMSDLTSAFGNARNQSDGKHQSVGQAMRDADVWFASSAKLPPYTVEAVGYAETRLNPWYCQGAGRLHADGHGHGMFGCDDRFNPQIPNWADFDIDVRTQAAQCALHLVRDNQLYFSGDWHATFSAYNAGAGGAQQGQRQGDSDLFTSDHHYGREVCEYRAWLEISGSQKRNPIIGGVYGLSGNGVVNSGLGVAVVQKLLTEAHFATTVDGSLGPATDSQIRAFQSQQGIGVDGLVGQDTYTRLCGGR